MLFSLARNLNSLAIERECRQIHLPHAIFSHAQSLHSTDDMCAWLKVLYNLKSELCAKNHSFIHASCLVPCCTKTLKTSTSSLSLTYPVLHSSTSPDSRPVVHASNYPLAQIHGRMALLRNTNLSQVMSPRGSSSTGPCSTYQNRKLTTRMILRKLVSNCCPLANH